MTIKTRVLTDADLELVDDFISKTFYSDEPIAVANGILFTPKGLNQIFLPDGLSVAACDVVTRQIVGAAINTASDEPRCYKLTDDDKKFQHMFEYMERISNVFNVAPNAVEIRYLAVDKAWRGRGIAQAIVEASVQIARQEGYNWIKMYTTSDFSNSLMVKMKWKMLYSLSYKQYLAEFDSDIRIPPEPHTRCNLYICDLKAS